MASKFTDRIKELEPKHYIFILVATIIFAGAIYGIVEYRQNNLGEGTTLEEGLEEEAVEAPTEVPEAPTEEEVPQSTEATTTKPKATTTENYNDLNDSGPETLWIGELTALSGSAVLWVLSKKRKKI